MFEYGDSYTPGVSSTSVRYSVSVWDRLFGRASWIELVNIRNAFIEDQKEEMEILREGVIELQPEKQLASEAKYLDEIGVLKERIKTLEGQLQTSQNNALTHRRESEQAKRLLENERNKWKPEPMLSKPERAQALGCGHVEPNGGAHSVSGQVPSVSSDSFNIGHLAAAALIINSDSDRTSGDMGRSSEVCAPVPAYVAPSRSEPAYSEPARESYSAPDSTPSYTDSGSPGGCD